jgi:hypothetical protein
MARCWQWGLLWPAVGPSRQDPSSLVFPSPAPSNVSKRAPTVCAYLCPSTADATVKTPLLLWPFWSGRVVLSCVAHVAVASVVECVSCKVSRHTMWWLAALAALWHRQGVLTLLGWW